ncbi:hypothetical protein B0H15DRAFT_790815 [Mycena belliarum]|uniref:Uncharacterized protein n=1 Tax=Mycena belliarum TaxID=1033014 RepID=A0AAD6TSM3_9AGAR|nr:hypothetical protein B0H15DRAFT_790815 [Mycena belliae]
MDGQLSDLTASALKKSSRTLSSRTLADIIWPYPNLSSWLLGKWFWNDGDKKTKSARKGLLEILLSNVFKVDDLRGVNFDKIDDVLGSTDTSEMPSDGNGWKTSTITIKIPTGQKSTKAAQRQRAAAAQTAKRYDMEDPDAEEVETHKFDIPGFHHRSLIHVMRSIIQFDDAAKAFHWHPYEQFWTPAVPWANPERVHDELYCSPAFVEADRKLQASSREPNCTLPRVIAGFMFWSDATHVAQFGQAKLWPIYSYFGNQSKYSRAQPSSRASSQVAYLQSLPDTIQDFARKQGKVANTQLLAHCRRELFHESWKHILDDEFVEAYKHGVVIDCADGIRRRVYPRIFTYSADYPEKVLLATLRDMGKCPCPRCKIAKEDIPDLGTDADAKVRVDAIRRDDSLRREKVAAARKLIYEDGYVVNSARVEDLLKSESLVPTENAFTKRLEGLDFDIFDALVVDFLHETELGDFKSIIKHLVRILNTLGPDVVNEFNERYRQVSSFGRSTIRRFPHNVSEMKKLGARDYEDILQCLIPCIEGLIPSPHNESILSLLYTCTYWHSLAKLRMHTDSSLKVLEAATVLLGKQMRHFAHFTCPHFKTVETDSEYASRSRAAARREATKANPGSNVQPSNLPNAFTQTSGKRSVVFSLNTYKHHALGDYVATIRRFGTTDSYSTQIGELQHRTVKKWNGRSNKNNAIPQIIKMDVREAAHERMQQEIAALAPLKVSRAPVKAVDPVPLDQHHRIAADESSRVYFRDLDMSDPAFKDFLPRLQDHLYARMQGIDSTEAADLTSDQRSVVNIQHQRIHQHATAAFNFTRYDVQRDQDTINSSTGRRYVMVKSNETDEDGLAPHPYWYARVLGVYHANVYHPAARVPRRYEFLRVRWFGRDPDWDSGPRHLALDRVGYVPEDVPEAFGFLDPALVLRSCHLIPAFSLGKTTTLLQSSTARDSDEGDWVNFYVMRFVDRDMMMRYLGTGVGHMQPAEGQSRLQCPAFQSAECIHANIG